MADSVTEYQNVLEFKVCSGGTVTIDLTRCAACEPKACIKVCQIQGGPLQLDADRGSPELRLSLAEIERGGCVECLGCELECDLSGQKALRVTLPIAGWHEYLEMLTEPTVYQR